MSTPTHTAARIEEQGHRLTGPRLAVLEAIEARPDPFTIEDLCDALPGVGRATVFRTVRLLQDLSLVCRVPLEDGSVRYQVSGSGHHHHLVCTNCGQVSDFADPELDKLIAENAQAERFALAAHSLELYGHCSSCQQAGASS